MKTIHVAIAAPLLLLLVAILDALFFDGVFVNTLFWQLGFTTEL